MQKNYLSGELIREIRKRKGFRQAHMQELGEGSYDSQVTLSRIENLRQSPSRNMLFDLLSKVELPYRQFFCPHMEDQPQGVFVLRHQITYLLDRAEGDEKIQAFAQELIVKLKSMLDLDSSVNNQLWHSLKAELDTISGRGNQETVDFIVQGIKITYPEFDEKSFDGSVLILYECELLISLARCYANMGAIDYSLAILSRIKEGCEKHPLSEMHKEIMLSEIQNLIVRLLLKKGDYSAALSASEAAVAASKKLSGSSRMPDSVYLRGMAIYYATGDTQQAAALMAQAYFSFALMKKDIMQQRVLASAREIIGVSLDTYNIKSPSFRLPQDFFSFNAGSSLAAHSIGGLLRQFRLDAGIKQADVYKGICSRSFYSRIEAEERANISFFILEALMQRLGRDMSLYVEYFSSVSEWEESRLRIQYSRYIYIGNTDEAQQALDKLMALGDFTTGPGKQFLLISEAMMKYSREDFGGYTDLLHRAVKETIPNFSEDTIANTRLTFNECNIINAIACDYADNGQIERAIGIFEALRESMNKFYVDDSAKAQFYITLLSNLSLYYCEAGQYQKALEFADECEAICQRHGVLFVLNDIAKQKAMCLHGLNRRDEAVAYAAMAYFSGSLTMQEHDLQQLESFAKEKLDIIFTSDLAFVFHKEKAGVYSEPGLKS